MSVEAEPLGRRCWVISEGYIPGSSTGPAPAFTSHETACILNTSDSEAHIRIRIFFADREPISGYSITVGPRRTYHMRFNELDDPEPIPRDTDYSSVIESDVPVVIQHTRLDSRQPPHALMTTSAYPAR